MAVAQHTETEARPRLGLKGIFRLLKEAVAEWSEDKAPRLGAALAYYTAFSLAPMLIIVIAVAGLVLGQREAAQQAVINQLTGLIGAQGATFVESTIEAQASRPATGVITAAIGAVTLLLGAIGAVGQLQDALNTIWEVKPKPGGGILRLLKGRLLSAATVLVIGFFLLVSLVVSAALTALGTWFGGVLPMSELLLEIVNFVVSLAVITVLFALMFKFMPDAKTAWRDVWIGALVTALLFTIGKTVIGLYLGNASVTSSYGAAGSLIVLLLWVYYSAQILFFGAEITQVYANQYGSRVAPKEGAERVTEGERAQQGLARDGRSHAGLGPRPPGVRAPHEPALPVVGPYEPTPWAKEALVTGQPLARVREAPDYFMALMTFAAGLGAGAIVALQTQRQRVGGWKLRADSGRPGRGRRG